MNSSSIVVVIVGGVALVAWAFGQGAAFAKLGLVVVAALALWILFLPGMAIVVDTPSGPWSLRLEGVTTPTTPSDPPADSPASQPPATSVPDLPNEIDAGGGGAADL